MYIPYFFSSFFSRICWKEFKVLINISLYKSNESLLYNKGKLDNILYFQIHREENYEKTNTIT